MEQESSWVFFLDFCSTCSKSLSYCCYLIDILFVESRHSEVTDILEKVIKLKKDFDESFLLGKSGKLFIARCVEMCLILHHFLIIFSIFEITPTFTFGSWLIFYSFPSSVNFVLLQFENHLIFTEGGVEWVIHVITNEAIYEFLTMEQE